MSDEIWKSVPSYPGLMASSWGRIKLPERTALMPKGGTRIYKTKPIYGYTTRSSKTALHVFKNVRSLHFGNIKVHKAVCEAFHGQAPFENAVVIHLDENGLNNRPENLKWGTQKENLNMPRFIEYCKSRTGDKNPFVKGRKV